MRHSPLCLAIAICLLAACSQQETRSTANDSATDPAEHYSPAAAIELEANAIVVDEAAAAGTIGAQTAAVQAARSRGDRQQRQEAAKMSADQAVSPLAMAPPPPVMPAHFAMPMPATAEANTEKYATLADNPVQLAQDNPVSTFSIDVDTGSYSNVRRMLLQGERPPADSVRAEEMINYFDYGYPAPATRQVPFLVSTEIAAAPWNPARQLLQIGIQGFDVDKSEIPASNLVFLVDTSGSMQSPDKLPLLKQSFRELVAQLRPQDRVSLVVYAGSAGLVLPPTAGDQQGTILAALDQLEAGGSTNGGAGLELAYAMARQAYIKGGVNRVVLATDGDFNVGTVNQEALETMVGDQRKSGVALTTLGFGSGNYNDAMAEQLADIGDGNHAYIDSISEGRKVLVEELSSTMLTIARDVKIQVEFNPAVVAEYRLIGYENRALRREDFNNDKVDAGEIGAGHDVTALYEITLVGSGAASVDPLRYGKTNATGVAGGEMAMLRLRYKQPGSDSSQLIEKPLLRSQVRSRPSDRLRWAASVAAFADLLRGGRNVGNFTWNDVRALASGATGEDRWGYRGEFLTLLDRARDLTGSGEPVAVSE